MDAENRYGTVSRTVLWLMIGVHVAAALAHQYLLGDRIMKRMA